MEPPQDGPEQPPEQPPFQAPGQPPYAAPYGQPYGQPFQQPGGYNPYQVEPRRGLSTGAWIGIILGGLALLGVALFGAIALFIGGFTGGFSDEFSPDDYGGALAQPCQEMLDAAGSIELFVPPQQAAAQLDAYIASGHRIVTALKDNGGSDSRWYDDWVRLLPPLEEYSADLAAGKDATFEEPTVDGISIVVDMSYESPYDCEMPPVIGALDRTPPDQDF